MVVCIGIIWDPLWWLLWPVRLCVSESRWRASFFRAGEPNTTAMELHRRRQLPNRSEKKLHDGPNTTNQVILTHHDRNWTSREKAWAVVALLTDPQPRRFRLREAWLLYLHFFFWFISMVMHTEGEHSLSLPFSPLPFSQPYRTFFLPHRFTAVPHYRLGPSSFYVVFSGLTSQLCRLLLRFSSTVPVVYCIRGQDPLEWIPSEFFLCPFVHLFSVISFCSLKALPPTAFL